MGETDIYTMLVVASVVLSILSSAGARGVVADPTVKLSVHYESLCGDSIRFVTKQLYPAWKHFGEDILKVDLNPFGKANVSLQHGPDECRGNKVQACILDKVSDPAEYVPLITCLMDSEFPPDAAGECIASLGINNLTWVLCCKYLHG